MASFGDAPRGILRAAALALLTVSAALCLSSCGSTGGGGYGPGAGHFGTVIVDAGHGGQDAGTRSRCGSPEKELTLDTARRLATVLRCSGLHVIETRTSDRTVPLCQRTAVSNRTSCAIFVSLHYNSTGRAGAQGIEIYFQSLKSKRLAANILCETTRAYRTDNRGIKYRGFYVLRKNRRPAVLCELGFVSNPSDNRKIHSPAVRQCLAERVAAGILAEKAGRQPAK